MDCSIHEYTGNGLENKFRFQCDDEFAFDVFSFIDTLPDANRWFLHSVQRVSEDIFVVTFRTNEYLSPNRPNDSLRVKVVRPEKRTDDFTLSLF